jgi:AcrR family transcriptional regulator
VPAPPHQPDACEKPIDSDVAVALPVNPQSPLFRLELKVLVSALVTATLEPPKPLLRDDVKLSLRERQKIRRRNRIYQVAIQLFKERGFVNTTATDIAKTAHVSRGTFFNYYPYKEAVLLDYGASIVSRLREMVELRKSEGAEATQILEELWLELASITQEEKDLIPPLTYELINPDPHRARAAYEAMPLAKIIEGLLRDTHRLRTDISLERISATLAYTFLMTALRWSAFHPDRPVRDELRKALSLTLEGAFKR